MEVGWVEGMGNRRRKERELELVCKMRKIVFKNNKNNLLKKEEKEQDRRLWFFINCVPYLLTIVGGPPH